MATSFQDHARNIGTTWAGFIATALALFAAFMWRDVFNAAADTLQSKLEPHPYGKYLHLGVRALFALVLTALVAAIYYLIVPQNGAALVLAAAE